MTALIHRVLLVLGLLLFLVSPVQAQPGEAGGQGRFAPDAEIRSAFDEVVREARASVVQVAIDGEERVLGTVVDEQGYILSKASELNGEEIEVFLPAGRKFEAELVGVDRKNDLAMLKIEADRLQAVSFSEQASADRLGAWVACVGVERSPVAVGVISAKAREIAPARLVLGVFLRPHTEGLWVDNVNEGFGAAKAGIQVGDVITHVGEKKVIASRQVASELADLNEGDEVQVLILRDGVSERVTVEVSESGPDPRSRSERMNRMGSTLSERRRGFELVLQHDAEIKPEHCGGPLLNLQGEVIGVNIARAGRIASYALPVSLLQERIELLKSGELAPQSAKPDPQPVRE